MVHCYVRVRASEPADKYALPRELWQHNKAAPVMR